MKLLQIQRIRAAALYGEFHAPGQIEIVPDDAQQALHLRGGESRGGAAADVEGADGSPGLRQKSARDRNFLFQRPQIGFQQFRFPAGFIESWGRGIEKICTVCKNDGVFQPEFTVHPQDIMIKFSAPEDRVVRTSTDRVTEKVTERVTEAENQLLALLMEDPAYTYEALSKKLKVSRKTIGGLIKSLKSKNIICRVGSDTKGYWQITLKN